MRILIIEDDKKTAAYLKKGLSENNFVADVADDGEDGLHLALTNDYALIILDVMLPGRSGWEVMHEIKKGGKQTAVLFLTAKDSIQDRVKGLELGADDYLVKPFAFDELVARIEALARRRFGMRNGQITIGGDGGLTLDTAARTVSRAGKIIDITAREYALLEFLALRRGRVFSRAEIEAHICDENADVMSNVVDAAVYSLRRKVDVPGKRSIIVTRRGMGYSIATGDDACPSDEE